MQVRVAWLASAVAWGCGGAPAEELLAPAAARTGEEGLDGPFGASLVTLRVAARVTEIVRVDVVYPSGDDLAPAVRGAPAVALIQGGLVAPERYRWLAVHLASLGIAVALPEATLDLAVAEPANGALALDALREASAPWGLLPGLALDGGPSAVGGHSLGGVVAAQHWAADPAVDGLFLLASYPAPGDPVEAAQAGRPVLALVGTADAVSEPVEIAEEMARFDGPVWLGEIAEMNHFAWTDEPRPGEIGRDGPVRGDLDEQRRSAQHALDLYLAAVFSGRDPATTLEAGVSGVAWR
jgi:hypothetical protein